MTGDRRERAMIWVEPSPAERQATIPDVWQWKYPQLIQLWRQAGAIDEAWMFWSPDAVGPA